METQHWIGEAVDCNYVTDEQENDPIERLSEIGRMLNSMMNKVDKFCGSAEIQQVKKTDKISNQD